MFTSAVRNAWEVETAEEIKARERFGHRLGCVVMIVWIILGIIGHFMKGPVPEDTSAPSALHYNSEEPQRSKILEANNPDARPFGRIKRERPE